MTYPKGHPGAIAEQDPARPTAARPSDRRIGGKRTRRRPLRGRARRRGRATRQGRDPGDRPRLARGPATCDPAATTMTTADLQPYVRLLAGRGAGTSYPLAPGDNVIGRDPEAEISIDSPDISRRHARLQVTADAVLLTDLGSKNGVIANGQPIEGEVIIGHGTRFQLGDLVFEIHHPGSQVQQALRRAGETTVTRMPPRAEEPTTMALRWPLLATLIFAGIVIALVLTSK